MKRFLSTLALVLTASTLAAFAQGSDLYLDIRTKNNMSDYMSGEAVRLSLSTIITSTHYGKPATVYLALSYQKNGEDHLDYYSPTEDRWIPNTSDVLEPLATNWIPKNKRVNLPDYPIKTDEILEVTAFVAIIPEDSPSTISFDKCQFTVHPYEIEDLLSQANLDDPMDFPFAEDNKPDGTFEELLENYRNKANLEVYLPAVDMKLEDGVNTLALIRTSNCPEAEKLVVELDYSNVIVYNATLYSTKAGEKTLGIIDEKEGTITFDLPPHSEGDYALDLECTLLPARGNWVKVGRCTLYSENQEIAKSNATIKAYSGNISE